MRSQYKTLSFIVFSILAFSSVFVLPHVPYVHAQFDPIFIGGDAGVMDVPPIFIGGDIGVIDPIFIGGDAGSIEPVLIGGDAGDTAPVFVGGDAGDTTPVFIGGDAGTPVVADVPIIPVVETAAPSFAPLVVVTPAPTCVLTASPAALPFGGGFSLLSWTITDANSASIDNGVDAVSANGSSFTLVSVTVTTNYTLTVSGPGGRVTCSAAVSVAAAAVVTPVLGCMDPTATNYNPAATSQSGVTCTYPVIVVIPPAILGCMDPTATNYNPAATSQSGVTCTYPVIVVIPPAILGCMDPTATNYNPAATSQSGITCTYPVVVVSGGGGGGGGSGGGSAMPTITLAALPHISAQPLAYLYLSQIPYTGLDLGPLGTMLYWIALIGWSLALAYFVLFGAVPVANRRLRDFGARVRVVLNTREVVHAVAPAHPVHKVAPVVHTASEPPRHYSSYEGFKSYAKNGALSIEDIVKGLSRHPHASSTTHSGHPKPNVEPIYEHVEPIYENVEPIVAETVVEASTIQPHIRGFAAALVEGDRAAVFAGLRQHIRGSGAPEHLLSRAVCLIDDAYRSRIDGTACDPEMARLTARLDTPTLEKLVASLATGIDSSYSTGVTGAKLALTRALSILGA